MHVRMRILFIFLLISVILNIVMVYKAATTQNPKLTEKYSLVNPASAVQIDSDVQPQNLILHYQDLKPMIELEISKVATSSDVGIFLQDTKTGAWLGLNERDGFFPASLLKVPLMMATLKKVERGELQLTDKVTLRTEDLNSESGDLYLKGVGATLTVWDLLKYMILSSDNTAKNAIKRELLPVEINAVFEHVGIANPYNVNESPLITPRGFSRLFKSLYLSSFLTPELSQRALDLTTDTQVESLISAGVPSEVQVAHKYGERPDGLGDCGIVYHPQNPYYLCIMTKNIEPMTAKELITTISRVVYNDVDAKTPVN